MDEVSASGPTMVAQYDSTSDAVSVYEITPEQVGIARGTLADIAGGDAAANARMVRAVLEGEHGPKRDIVLLNAAAAFMVADKVPDLAAGVLLARETIDSGRALSTLEALVTVSQRLSAAAKAREGASA
jgi:anthranilate phosphoribosyltransferase